MHNTQTSLGRLQARAIERAKAQGTEYTFSAGPPVITLDNARQQKVLMGTINRRKRR